MLQETIAESVRPRPGPSEAPPDPAQIREQLQRILKSHPFQASKRYPSVLSYLVNRALEGSPEGVLKERTIGVEVLGRNPNYDTNEDPTVRVVAGEIRKRLISYYQEPGHEAEIRIELPIGSYTPHFILGRSTDPLVAVQPRWRRKELWVFCATLSAALLILAGYRSIQSRTALDRFWDPVLHGSPSVLLCVGQHTAWGSPPPLNDPLGQNADPSLNDSDTIQSAHDMRRFISTQPLFSQGAMTAVAEIASFLRPKTSKELIRASSATSLEDLRQGPAILIGTFTNYWTIHVGDNLRFQFKRSNEEALSWIEDKDHPSKRDWAVRMNDPYTDVTADYAIITRVADASTSQIVVSVGGLTPIGLAAASEFLVNSQGWDAIARQAPRDWDHKNLQIVIVVNIVNGNAGTPKVLATYFW